MKIIRGRDYHDVSKKAANIIFAQIIMKQNSILGLATGSTPIGIYQQLIKWYEQGELDFSQVTTMNLDEYKGLPGDHRQSYRYFMNHHLFCHINIDINKTYIPNGMELNSERACREYNQVIRQIGNADLQLLGLGQNGHIGFNEPDIVFSKETHCVDLTESTIKANSRLFEKIEDVPKQAYTMGIKNIMSAKKILLVATGKEKADALKATICGPITSKVPASILQLHPDVVVVADDEALGNIAK